MESEHGRPDADLTGIMRDCARDASQRADEYYNEMRKAYENAYGHTFEDYATNGVYDPDHTLYRMVGGFNHTDWNGLNYTQLRDGRSRAGLTVDDLWPSLRNPDDAMQWAADMVRASARYTMERDIADDPTGPRWARVTGGAKPCAFCVMLAGRGFVYHSKEKARFGGSFHDGKCHCTAIPGWKDDVLTSAQQECKSMYEAGKAAAGENAPRNAELAAMRRIYADRLSDGVTPVPNIRWSHKTIRPTADELARLSDFTVRMPWDQYTPEQKRKALRGWTDGTFKQINMALYGHSPVDDTTRERIDMIDEAMSDHWTQRQFTVDRLMPLSTFELSSVEDAFDLVPGKTYNHPGYMATSLLDGGVLADRSLDRIPTRILVPPGSSAVYLQPISKAKKRQEEVLLARKGRLQIEGVEITKQGPMVFVRLVDWAS
ncbi:ADP-ribosyltransferase exoenzyme [Bifidobacterium margollesii]|uniref:ADP-ribosyltransferase exoenzyme n=1 Tax=Bifidobacterium margollesii TaxID=2020964 RepID=A0A2N5J7A9_9BIFI|nr:ADP-ribosyltransferase exoenzyme [Bifidobacterium margollesii]